MHSLAFSEDPGTALEIFVLADVDHQKVATNIGNGTATSPKDKGHVGK